MRVRARARVIVSEGEGEGESEGETCIPSTGVETNGAKKNFLRICMKKLFELFWKK